MMSRTPKEAAEPVNGESARSMAMRPASMTMPDNMALMPLGACEWASGSQVCSGTMATLTP